MRASAGECEQRERQGQLTSQEGQHSCFISPTRATTLGPKLKKDHSQSHSILQLARSSTPSPLEEPLWAFGTTPTCTKQHPLPYYLHEAAPRSRSTGWLSPRRRGERIDMYVHHVLRRRRRRSPWPMTGVTGVETAAIGPWSHRNRRSHRSRNRSHRPMEPQESPEPQEPKPQPPSPARFHTESQMCAGMFRDVCTMQECFAMKLATRQRPM